jgi:ammonium transporter Rh
MGFGRVEITFLLGEAISILFFGLFTEYKLGTDPKTPTADEAQIQLYMHDKYPMFQDVHVMIFIGFGFLMVFLKNNSWTSIGFNYLIACWAIQITILYRGFWEQILGYYLHDTHHDWRKVPLRIEEIINADFGAAAVLITFGAILGKCSLFQLWWVATLELCFYTLNEAILVNVFKVQDIGGSMIIHTFGAYFGLSVALFYQPRKAIADKHGIGKSNYLSDLVSMIGTLFLFAYWPSFNAALGSGSTLGMLDDTIIPAGAVSLASKQQRAVINTYLSISCSCIASIISSKIIHGGKLDMEIVLNSSIAGGVAIGASADIIVMPFGAMLTGFIAGVVSSFGYGYLSRFLQKHIYLHDTCGVHNLHGMPGVIGGIVSAIVASRGSDNFGANYGSVFSNGGLKTQSSQGGL